MDNYLWRNLFILIPSFLAVLYGAVRVFPRTKGLYFRLGTMAMACLFAGYLSTLTIHITDSAPNVLINVSVLGNIGFSLFLITQNADSVSSIMYYQGKTSKKNFWLSLIPSLIILAINVGFEILIFKILDTHALDYWVGAVGLLGFSTLLNAITVFFTTYYSLAPDEEGGMVYCLRPYNILLTVILVLLSPERFIVYIPSYSEAGTVALIAYYTILAVAILAVIPIMERGRLKFLTSL